MAPEPLVKPLSHSTRMWVFRGLLAVFVLLMPAFVFYAMGYRLDLSDRGNFITVGGFYLSADAEDVAMFVDEEPVTNMRIFQNAAYVQNVEAGVHRVHVQRDGLQTWVKELPVYPHIVTEAHSFNLPLVPQIRYIPKWVTAGGMPVFFADSPNEIPFPTASTTNALVATTSASTVTYTQNSEYEYIRSLFVATTTAESEGVRRAVDVFQSDFSWSADTLRATTTSTTSQVQGEMRLSQTENDVYADWIGSDRSIPYYFCVTYTSPATTTEEYGAHVYESLVEQLGTTTDLTDERVANTRLCRDRIRVDDIGQEVAWFGFLPSSMHHVLMLLEDGLYVVEIDDRSWQNTQLLYPGDELEVRIDGGRIYVYDGTYYFEALTELAS